MSTAKVTPINQPPIRRLLLSHIDAANDAMNKAIGIADVISECDVDQISDGSLRAACGAMIELIERAQVAILSENETEEEEATDD